MRKLMRSVTASGVSLLTAGFAFGAGAIVNDPGDLDLVDALEGPAGEHCEEAIAGGDFLEIFVCGDEFFEFQFNATEGAGANVGNGQRFTRVPQPRFDGPGEWADHFPRRTTGPNAAGCVSCHNHPEGTAAGLNALNVIRDPNHTGRPHRMINRNTPMLMGSGALQLLAEEMNVELEAIVEQAIDDACESRTNVTRRLVAKGVDYGSVRVAGRGTGGKKGKACPRRVDIREDGIDEDLIVKPFQWKGTDKSLRIFNRGALHNEIGMQAVELVGSEDGDGDGVVNEVSIEDVTALTIYVAGQPRPVTEVELSELRDRLAADYGADGEAAADELGLPALSADEIAAIGAGEDTFMEIGCGGCHVPSMTLHNPVFSEPARNPNYREDVYPAGQPGLTLAEAVTFDLRTDMPDNIIEIGGMEVANVANYKTDDMGNVVVELWGDLKRHDMGRGLAESIRDEGIEKATFMTKELWGRRLDEPVPPRRSCDDAERGHPGARR